jgi:hypothetical protein
MSIYSAIVNQNTIKRVSYTTALASGNEAFTFATIPVGFNYGTINTIRVTADITDCAAPPAYADIKDIGIGIYQDTPTKTGIEAEALSAVLLADLTYTNILTVDRFVEDANKSNFIYISIENSNADVPEGMKYVIDIDCTIQLSSSISDGDVANNYIKDQGLRILRLHGTELIDITSTMTNYAFIDNSQIGTPSNVVFDTANDKLYIGSGNPISKIRFIIPTASEQTIDNTLTVNYTKDDGTFDAATLEYNGTTSEASIGGFQQSGIIKIDSSTWSDGIRTQLTEDFAGAGINDPRYLEEVGIHNGTYPPQPFFINPDRYWLEFSFDAITAPIEIDEIHLIS